MSGREEFSYVVIALVLLLLLLCQGRALAQAPPSPQGPTLDQPTIDRLQHEGLKLNFEDVDVKVLARIISQVTGRNIVLDQKVQGKVTLVSTQRLSPDQAWEMFVSALEAYGFGVENMGKFYKVAPIAVVNQKTMGIYPKSRARTSVAVIKVLHMPADQMVNLLRPLLSSSGVINGFPNTNTVVVSDDTAIVQRTIKLAKQLDVATTHPLLRIYYPRRVRAADVAKNIETLYTDRNQVKVTVHLPTNSLLVYASPEAHATIERMLASLERREQVEAEPRQPFVYTCAYAQAEDLAKIIAEMLNEKQRVEESNLQKGIQTSPTPGAPAIPGLPPGFPNPNQLPPGNQALGESGSRDMGSSSSPTPFRSGAETYPGAGASGGAGFTSGKVSADPSTNSLILYVTRTEYEMVKKLVEQLDTPRRQVLVSAIIAEVSLSHIYQSGVNWQRIDPKTGSVFGFGGGQSLSSLVQILASGQFVAGAVDPNSSTITAQGQTVTFPNSFALVQFLQNNSDLNLIASPRLLTHNHKQANIKVGTVEPFATGVKFDINGQPIINFDYREVGLELQVTPHISQDRNLRLEVHQDLQEVVDFIKSGSGAASFQVPVVSKREVNTEVSLMDGQSLIIGGLVQKKTINKMTKIPILGDIPLLGDLLFKNKNKETDKTTLFIFLTPHIIDSPQKMMEITNQYDRMFERHDRVDKEELNRSDYHPQKQTGVPARRPSEQPVPGPVPSPSPGGQALPRNSTIEEAPPPPGSQQPGTPPGSDSGPSGSRPTNPTSGPPSNNTVHGMPPVFRTR